MQNKKTLLILLLIVVFIALFEACSKDVAFTPDNTAGKVLLGSQIFFDKSLSNPVGQSCASCHSPSAGFSDPERGITVKGAINSLSGNRNCPTVTYAAYAPAFHFSASDSAYAGGLFWDGRVNNLQEQAQKPFLNKLEMNNTDATALAAKLRKADYFPLYEALYGVPSNAQAVLTNMADALAAYERSPEVNAFTSKFDFYLKGQAQFTDQERRGLQLFNDSKKGNCAACHSSQPDARSGKVLFTDFTYDNIGVPKNSANPFYTIPAAFNPLGARALDYGLGGVLKNAAYNGHFRVPTLRNVALTAPYFHNGYFKTLEEVVHFYNKRDTENFPSAEFPATVNHSELGNLHLSAQEEKDIVAFLKTLSDGYK